MAIKFDLGDIRTDYLQELQAKNSLLTRRVTVKSFDTPIDLEILQNLPQFCFPGKLTTRFMIAYVGRV